MRTFDGGSAVAIGASTVIACHVMNFAYHYGANAKWDPVRKVWDSLYQTQLAVLLTAAHLTDATGTVIHSIGDDDFLGRASKVALAPGANWSEQAKGTNAVGTALIEERPVLRAAYERFLVLADKKKQIYDDDVFALLADSRGRLWVGTDGGLDRFEPTSETFTHYRHNPDDPASLSNDAIRALFVDDSGALAVKGSAVVTMMKTNITKVTGRVKMKKSPCSDREMLRLRSIMVAISGFLPFLADVDNDRGRLDRADHFADAAADAGFMYHRRLALAAVRCEDGLDGYGALDRAFAR